MWKRGFFNFATILLVWLVYGVVKRLYRNDFKDKKDWIIEVIIETCTALVFSIAGMVAEARRPRSSENLPRARPPKSDS